MYIRNNQIQKTGFDIRRSAPLVVLLATAIVPVVGAQQAPAVPAAVLDALRTACQGDVQNLCSGTQPGGGRVLQCLMQHKDQVSNQCKQAYMAARQAAQQQQNQGQTGQSQAQDAGPDQSQESNLGTPESQAPAQDAWQSQSNGQTSSEPQGQPSSEAPAQPSSGPRYFRMKRVQIDDKADNVPAAVHVMIPTTWQLQGSIRTMGGFGGCFADLESISVHAQSADGSLVFDAMPDLTWQYADDQQTVRTMMQEGQGFAKAGMKPCPVMPPQRATDFLRKIIPKYYADAHIVSVDADPQLDQLVRERLGLSLKGAEQGSVRTDAARARLEYERDGRTIEQWVTVGEWMRAYSSGRGNVYDCHATMLMSFSAPKGQLDGNENLFTLIASNISHDPQWDAHINAMIAKLYQQQQVEEAKRSQMIAQFQQHVADTVSEVTANAQRGADQAAFGEDQIIRGVQTFRNPETGDTFELSNLHDHAWLNGNNEYIMSDDPNYNPNGQLDGSWTQLEPVQAQP